MIPRPLHVAFTHPINQQVYQLESCDDAARFGPHGPAQVALACNQERIYQRLFARRWAGRPYTEADGAGFLRWSAQGWAENTHFVFALTHAQDGIVGAIDIKTPPPQPAEVGYWLRAEHGGLMADAVRALLALAGPAGFAGLWTVIDPDNARSQAVMGRAGFQPDGALVRDGVRMLRYTHRC